ncbi:hypothetical protein PRZ48_011145 [Zasmidium cellare]|uniref:Uncharacterized protein n=1 Tax=Zasmidium cellare TaxID=395010 RepID=A0ABR0EAK2_ZASCE|nr:hypothetical protein PRZ48_011145 [Zasmidium cellare]
MKAVSLIVAACLVGLGCAAPVQDKRQTYSPVNGFYVGEEGEAAEAEILKRQTYSPKNGFYAGAEGEAAEVEILKRQGYNPKFGYYAVTAGKEGEAAEA